MAKNTLRLLLHHVTLQQEKTRKVFLHITDAWTHGIRAAVHLERTMDSGKDAGVAVTGRT
ncbi:hypothetical protein [Desulforhopalus singaporensis]|uniref:hypothetical protein n=1 Tax=Desulforhopalus singaporensis TaxID=91360 RepID=UPI000B8951AC|nr:hypothetical protein [Desulforhopalus singaporensis]